MNIEEERKAFEAWEYSGMPDIGPWQTWLAAKAHAEEMAKPKYMVIGDPGRYTLYRPDEELTEVFCDPASAMQWAKDNGYRVVSE